MIWDQAVQGRLCKGKNLVLLLKGTEAIKSKIGSTWSTRRKCSEWNGRKFTHQSVNYTESLVLKKISHESTNVNECKSEAKYPSVYDEESYHLNKKRKNKSQNKEKRWGEMKQTKKKSKMHRSTNHEGTKTFSTHSWCADNDESTIKTLSRRTNAAQINYWASCMYRSVNWCCTNVLVLKLNIHKCQRWPITYIEASRKLSRYPMKDEVWCASTD